MFAIFLSNLLRPKLSNVGKIDSNHHSFLEPNMFIPNSSEKDDPQNIPDITLFANTKHFKQRDRTVRMVSFIHSQIAWNCMGPSTCLLAVMWECGRRCGSGIEIKTSSKSKAITSLIYRVPRIVDPFRSQIYWRYSLLWQKVGRPNAMYPIIRKRNTPSTSGVYLTFGM